MKKKEYGLVENGINRGALSNALTTNIKGEMQKRWMKWGLSFFPGKLYKKILTARIFLTFGIILLSRTR